MINICHFADHLNGKMDGVFNHIKMIVENTDKKTYKHFLCFQGDPFIEKEFTSLGGEIILIPSIKKKIPIRSFQEFYHYIKEKNIQIIHTHYLKPYVVAGFTNIILRKKLIYNYHGLFINNDFYNRIEKIAYRIAHYLITLFNAVHLVLAPSLRSKELILKETNRFPRVITYYNGTHLRKKILDNDLVKEIEKDYGFKIAFIGRLEKEKRLDFALRLMKFLEEKNINAQLYVIGDGSLMKEYIKLTEELGLSDKVIFQGYVENIIEYLNKFNLLLITSDSEGIPFVMWEAMSNAVPILSSNVGGIPEIIEKEKCGLIFKKNDINDAFDKLFFLIKNKQQREIMGSNGRKAILGTYNSHNFSETIEKIYSQLTEI